MMHGFRKIKMKHRLLHNILSMFRYLINDPKYLLARTKEAFVNAGYLRNSIKPRPGSLEECGSARAGLVIEGDPSLYSTIIMQFHDAFGENSIIYKKIDDRHLVVITSNRQETERVLCTRIEANVLFWPKTATLNPIKDQLVCAYLAIIENGVNIAVISHGLAMGQTISVGCIRDHMLFTRTVAQDVFNGQLGNTVRTDRICWMGFRDGKFLRYSVNGASRRGENDFFDAFPQSRFQ